MQSVAAYYVLVATEDSSRQRPAATSVVVRRPSSLARIAARLGSLVVSGRPVTAQTA